MIQKGNVYSASTYGSDGNIVARIDFQGKPHYIGGEYILPHVHLFQNNNGYIGEAGVIPLEEYLKRLL